MKNLKFELKWAVVFTVVSLLWMIMERMLGWHDEKIDQHMYLTNLYIIPAIIVVVLGMRDKRNNFYGGKINYKQGLIFGLLMTVIILLLNPAAQYITLEFITPDYLKNATNYAVETGMMEREAAMDYFNLKNYIIQGTIGGAIMGTITSAIVAIFMRKS